MIDILINNAGIIRWAGLPEADVDNLASHLAVHVTGSFNTTRAAWPHMVDQGYGRIVMTTSSGLFGLPQNLSYATAKGAVIGLTRSLSTAGAAHGIKVNLIAPARLHPDGRPARRRGGCHRRRRRSEQMSPDLVAPMVAFLAHEDCPVSGEIYAAGFGRFARIFIASTEGYVHPTPQPTIEDVAEHWATINDETGYYVPADLMAWSTRSWPTWSGGGIRMPARTRIHPSPEVGRMDLSLSESEQELVGLCRDFAHEEIARRAPLAWDEARCPTDLLREMGQLGLLGMLVPEEWGGIGMSTVGFVAAMEQIGQADQSVAAAWQAHVTIGSLPLYLFGNDAQRERWLRPLAEGRVLGAFGLTEPDAGSDARGIRTRAERRDGGWLINGRKTFISNAGTDMSFGVTLLARVEPAEGGKPRFGSFVVEKDTAGFTMGPKMRGIGWRGPRHPRAVLRRRLGSRRSARRRSEHGARASSCARSRWGASRSPPCRSA